MVCSPLGKILFFSFMTHWGSLCWFYSRWSFLNSLGKFFSSQPLRELSLCLGPVRKSFMIIGKNLFILWVTRDLVDGLNSRGSFLNDFQSAEGCSWSFQSTRDALRVLVCSILLSVFLSFLDAFLNFSLYFLPSGNTLGISWKFFFVAKLHVV